MPQSFRQLNMFCIDRWSVTICLTKLKIEIMTFRPRPMDERSKQRGAAQSDFGPAGLKRSAGSPAAARRSTGEGFTKRSPRL
jgi:hypothetical protein